MLPNAIGAPRLAAPTTKEGPKGRAWKIALDAWKANGEPIGTTICLWIVEVLWAHPAWHSYTLGAVHLRQAEGVPPAKIGLPGATHEVLLHALNPEYTPRLDRGSHYLTPANFVGQWVAESDEAAAAKIEGCVDDIIAGRLSPDTDFRGMWIARFSDSNVKSPKHLLH